MHQTARGHNGYSFPQVGSVRTGEAAVVEAATSPNPNGGE